MKARAEWLDIVEARHLLWTFISSQKRELIRSVFNTLNLEIVKRNRPTSVFNFAEASVGNLFLTGYVQSFLSACSNIHLIYICVCACVRACVYSARLFSGSFESAIYLLSLICAIPESISVLPAINSNFTHHISASLVDGSVLAGQVAISHPSGPTAVPDDTFKPTGNMHLDLDRVEDANLPGSLPVLRGHHAFSKEDEEDLACRVDRVWYINPYGHEIWPVANPEVLAALEDSDTVVYSIGSLYTSIIPSLILRGVGTAIGDQTSSRVRNKVLILNAKIDRETGPTTNPMTAVDFVKAIAKAAKESQTDFGEVEDAEVGRYVSHLVYLKGSEVGSPGSAVGTMMPRVDVVELEQLGIKCVKVKGTVAGEGRKRIVRYEEGVLVEALEGIIG